MEIEKNLKRLHNRKLIHYIPKSGKPFITFLEEKLPLSSFRISKENYEWRKERAKVKMDKMIDYVLSDSCRSQLLLNYFGQSNSQECGQCDYCFNRAKSQVSIDQVAQALMPILSQQGILLDVVFDQLNYPHDKIIQAIDLLQELEQIVVENDLVKLANS
jgi:ATP-dependent DNA helicase RecQ